MKKKKQCLMQWQARCEKPPNATEFFLYIESSSEMRKKKKKKICNKPVHPNTIGI